jgi:hypothetical protein
VFITDFFILKNSQIALIIAFPMLIQLFAHGIVVPNILTIALKDYKKYAGTAGSIFGSAYYIIVSSVNLLISVIHNGSMHPVAILFVNLSMLSIALYYIAITFASSSQHIANSKNHY